MSNNNIQGIGGLGGSGGSSSMKQMMDMMMSQRMTGQGQNGETGMMPPPPFMQNGQGTMDQMNMSPDAMMEMMMSQGENGQGSTEQMQQMQQMMQMLQQMMEQMTGQGQNNGQETNGQGENGQKMNPAQMFDQMAGAQIGQGLQDGSINQEELQTLIARKQEKDQMMQSLQSNGQPDKSQMEELRNFDMQTMQMIQEFKQQK